MNEYVFLITERVNDEDEEATADVFEFNTLKEVNDRLDQLTYGETDSVDLVVYQGILIPALYVPEKLNGLTPYIYIKNPEGKIDPAFKDDAIFVRASKNVNKTTSMIEEFLSNPYLFLNINDSPVSIEDVYLFFGDELFLSLQVIEANVDEDVLFRALTLKNSVNEFKSPNNLKVLENYE